MRFFAAFITFVTFVVIFVVMVGSLVLNGYYYTNLASINDELSQATGSYAGDDALGLEVKRTESLARRLIQGTYLQDQEIQRLSQDLRIANCRLAPIGKLGEAVNALPNPFSVVPRVIEAAALMRPCR